MKYFIRSSILIASLSFNFFTEKGLYIPTKKYVTLKQENAEIQDNLRKEETKIATAKNVKEENHQQKQN